MPETPYVTIDRSGTLWLVKVTVSELTYRTARAVAAEVKAFMQERFGELLVLDLTGVSYADSVGMGILLELQNTARQQRLSYWVRVSVELYRPLEKVRLTRVIDMEVLFPNNTAFVPEGRQAGRRSGRDRRAADHRSDTTKHRSGKERRTYSPSPRRDRGAPR